MHALWLAWELYVPTGHAVQLDAVASENEPAMQLVHTWAPALLNEPAEHVRQADAPAAEYLPAGHC